MVFSLKCIWEEIQLLVQMTSPIYLQRFLKVFTMMMILINYIPSNRAFIAGHFKASRKSERDERSWTCALVSQSHCVLYSIYITDFGTFVLFINDVTFNFAECRISADDLKIFSVTKNQNDLALMQNDINRF